MIYLDNAATTYPKPKEVLKTMVATMEEKGANPGRGGYHMAIEAAKVIFNARGLLADFINAQKAEEIIFTANATEAINLALKGLLLPGDHVITTSMEHNSVFRPLIALQKQGVKLTVVDGNAQGEIDIQKIEKSIIQATKLVIMTHASNVCGTIMPIEAVGKIARDRGIVFAVDASQSLGFLPIDVQNMKIDLLAFPGHKGLYAPPGTGGLYIKSGIALRPLKEGGTGVSSHDPEMPEVVPERYEAGTLNLPGIAGLAAGLSYICKLGSKKIINNGNRLTAMLIEGLESINEIEIYGPADTAKQVPVVAFNFKNLDAAEAALILDKKYEIAVRAGLHCAPLAHKTLGTLDRGAVRASLGTFNTEKDIQTFLDVVKEMSKL